MRWLHAATWGRGGGLLHIKVSVMKPAHASSVPTALHLLDACQLAADCSGAASLYARIQFRIPAVAVIPVAREQHCVCPLLT